MRPAQAIAHLGGRDSALGVREALEFDVVGDRGAVISRVEHIFDREPRVIAASVVVKCAARQRHGIEHRLGCERARWVDPAMALRSRRAREQVVEPKSRAKRKPARAAPAIKREEKAQGLYQVRRRQPAQALALGERRAHQAEFALRQVAQPAVNQLGGARGGRTGEVAALDHRDI